MKFLSVKSAVPTRKMSSADIVKKVRSASAQFFSNEGLDDLCDEIEKLYLKSGTNECFHLNDENGETPYELLMKAGREALSSAGIAPSEIDCLIYVGVSRGFLEPATANVFQHSLGLVNATCYDILDACASWIRALQVAYLYTQMGIYKKIMIVNSEFNASSVVSYQIRDKSELKFKFPGLTLGEAATATIIGVDQDKDGKEDFYFTFKNFGKMHKACKIPLKNYLKYSPKGEDYMDSAPSGEFFSFARELFTFTSVQLIKHFRSDTKLKTYQPDIIFTHSASDAFAENLMRQVGMSTDLFYQTHSTYGNTVSASLPLAISLAEKEGRLRKGSRVMMCVGSAGVTTAFATFTYN
ncbi:hypothetical protein DLM76_12400 [Leptospira yasudae]|uniref:3-oxoacyl-ACP synthase III family protein n=1 Tax=Leptospira yasudae TaxID=2202201 RepID=UPI000E5A0372|nr:3-oxoacyl-[acyl-carrier-protein] synthase III C-terminal domain-containing protein [Leptospira yasudae]RHX93794.1 hypothetical protein DLM76_12400 [Leptospira yasudae]